MASQCLQFAIESRSGGKSKADRKSSLTVLLRFLIKSPRAEHAVNGAAERFSPVSVCSLCSKGGLIFISQGPLCHVRGKKQTQSEGEERDRSSERARGARACCLDTECGSWRTDT